MDENENIYDGLVINPELENTAQIPTDKQKPANDTVKSSRVNTKLKQEESPIGEPAFDSQGEEKEEDPYAGLVMKPELEFSGKFDNRQQIDLSKYKGYIGPDIYMPQGGIEVLDASRAKNQPFYEQAGAFLGQAAIGEIVGGTIEGFGYVLDVASIADVIMGNETDWGNFITDFGQGIREGMQEAAPIYTDPTKEGWGQMADTGWWFSNAVSVASTVSMLAPTMGVTRMASMIGKGIGWSKGMGVLREAVGLSKKMGKQSRWMSEGISQAVVSRNIENWMESHGTYEATKEEFYGKTNPETGEKFTDEEINKFASQAASENWKNGWAMLAQDMTQYLALGRVFNPATRRMEKAISSSKSPIKLPKLKPWQSKVASGFGTFLSEGGEEAYQFYISERAKLRSELRAGLIDEKEYERKMNEAIGNEEMMTSAFFGGLGGNVFQAVGPGIAKLSKTKTRRELEAKAGEIFAENLKIRGSHLKQMAVHLAQADIAGDPTMRRDVIDTYMAEAVAESLEHGKFEQLYETIDGMDKMSQDEIAEFNKENPGAEYNQELAKQYTPELKKMALDMREKYLKYSNKYSKHSAAQMVKIDYLNQREKKLAEEKGKQAESIKNDIGASYQFATESQKNNWERKENKKVLESRIEHLQEIQNNTESPQKKKWLQNIIDEHKDSVENIDKADKEERARKKDMTAQEKDVYGFSAKSRAKDQREYKRKEAEIVEAKMFEQAHLDSIEYNEQYKEWLKSEEGEKSAGVTAQKEAYKQADTIEKINSVRERIKNEPDFSEKDKEEVLKVLEERFVELEMERKEKEDEERRLKHEEDIRKKQQELNSDPEVIPNDNNTPIHNETDTIDGIEDENADLDYDTGRDLLDKHEENSDVRGAGNLKLADSVRNTETFQRWAETPVSKVGKVFTLTVADGISDKHRIAIEDFEKAKREGTKIPNHVFDDLPIKATLKGSSGVYTYLFDKQATIKGGNYHKDMDAQRRIIIQQMYANDFVDVEVASSTGGQLQTEYDTETNSVARNPLTSLPQMLGDINKISDNLMVTNEKGYLENIDGKPDEELGDVLVSAGKGKDGADMPYRGGVFLKVRMANGAPFHLRLNLAKNTQVQAELLAEMLIRVAVPIKSGFNPDGSEKYEKEFKTGTLLSEVDEEFRKEIQEAMATEIEMLDPENKDPKLLDLIDTFLYVSEKTEGKTSELFWRGNDLFFGGERMSPGFRSNPEMINTLVSFLMNTKRRQFNVKMWKSNPNYRRYAIEQGVLTTNAVVDGPLFTNEPKMNQRLGRMTGRIQLSLKPVQKPQEAGITKDDEGNVSLSQNSKNDGAIDENGPLADGTALFGVPKKQTPPKQKTMWQTFVDTGVVPEDKLREIALAIADGTPITGQEVAYRDANSKVIEKMLQEILAEREGNKIPVTDENQDLYKEINDWMEKQNHKPDQLAFVAKRYGVSPEIMGHAIRSVIESTGAKSLANTPDFPSAIQTLKVLSRDTISARLVVSNIEVELEKSKELFEKGSPKAPVKEAVVLKENEISYTPKGQQRQTYTVQQVDAGEFRILNKEGKEVHKEEGAHRNKILANFAIQNDEARVVVNAGVSYVVHDDGRIVSFVSGAIMKWDDNHGIKKSLIKKAKEMKALTSKESGHYTIWQPGQIDYDATITDINVKVGDVVTAGQQLFEYDTDKASSTIEAEYDGIVKEIRFKKDDITNSKDVIIIVEPKPKVKSTTINNTIASKIAELELQRDAEIALIMPKEAAQKKLSELYNKKFKDNKRIGEIPTYLEYIVSEPEEFVLEEDKIDAVSLATLLMKYHDAEFGTQMGGGIVIYGDTPQQQVMDKYNKLIEDVKSSNIDDTQIRKSDDNKVSSQVSTPNTAPLAFDEVYEEEFLEDDESMDFDYEDKSDLDEEDTGNVDLNCKN